MFSQTQTATIAVLLKKLLQDEDDAQIEEMIEDVSSSQSLSLGQWSQTTKKRTKILTNRP